MLQTNNIRDLLSRYYSGELSTCKFCGKQGMLVAGESNRGGELELAHHEFHLFLNGVQVSKYAVCYDCKRKMLEAPVASVGNVVD